MFLFFSTDLSLRHLHQPISILQRRRRIAKASDESDAKRQKETIGQDAQEVNQDDAQKAYQENQHTSNMEVEFPLIIT